MKITIIIPTLNEEKYLPKTLVSLKKLYLKPDEILIVDSNSTDKTVSVAKKAGVKVITTKRKGIGFARNLGLKKAKGDIVAYTDSDTVVPRDWTMKIVETLIQNGVSGVYGIFQVPSGWWVYRRYVNHVQPYVNLLASWFGIPMAPGQNIAFKRKIGIKAGGFPEDYKIAEDIEMATRLKKLGKVVFRKDLMVLSSGRRGKEGPTMMGRVFKTFFLYFFFKKGNRISFPAIR